MVAIENEQEDLLTFLDQPKGQCQQGGLQWVTNITCYIFIGHTHFTVRMLIILSNQKIIP